ncbi:cadherin-like beta sandwich domain-containing protein [Pannonibacter phragmitetus]|uniref:cadherin-like beta sandwich domain-containing protein n=1 Tax=Pannonibacter phragmitetus TaxID=121719 RepID=UPI0019802B34|nr:cadherin-like beta sandwich domain-containing protein [Pannonibacter phragmitetus]
MSCTANPPITLSPAAGALPAGQEGAIYNQTITASGGAGAYTYAVTGGSLPAGVNLNASNGELTGTPTTAGTANFTITATDTDGAFGSAAYSLQINAPASTVATLSNLVLSQGTLTPGFASGTTSYTASVGNAVTSLTVTPTVTDANATVTVNTVPVTSGNASGAINLNVGSNIITVVVTAEDGTTTETYTVDVTRAAATVATLSGLVLSQGTLDPVFASGTTSYTASVGNAVTSLTVTPTVTDANATVTVNTVPVLSGNASGAINLTVGSNIITVVVTAEDGTTTETYTVDVTRAAATDATLSNLVLSQGTLDPVFASGTTSYTASVGNAVTSLTVTPTVTDANATVTVNTVPVTSGNASGAISLTVGSNIITVVVTAEDGTTTETYTVDVTRAAATDATLSGLVLSQGTLDPVFASGTTSYTASVGNAVTSLTVTPTVTDANATVTVNTVPVTSGNASGAINLNVGSNVITVVVTAEDGTTTETYTVDVTRAAPASTDATLANLVLSQGTLDPVFASGTTSYTASVGNAVTSLTVTPTVTDANATITVNTVPVTSGNASGAINLTVGSNVITVVVTAEDGTTTETYTVDVTRAAATDATLSNLVLSQGTLDPVFASGTTSYTASVGNAVTSLTVTPTVTEANATVTVNGTSVTSGNASGAINLTVGDNTLTIIVTAQNGTTTETYTVTVNRAAPAATDASLANLVLSQGTLDPVFASGTTSYTASVGNAVTSLTVTPTVTDANATVTVNTVPVTSGNASGAINLTVGSNIITVVVTAEDGTTTETYTVDVTRAAPASTDATLSNLVLSQGTLTPGFASGTTSYTASVGNAVTSLTVTPTVTDANATITVNGTSVTSGSASGAINLNVGSNIITVVVTAEDGTTTETYTVDVTRAAPASADATLSNLVLSQGTLTPGFASGTTSYTASVGNAVTSLTVTPTVTDANATITVNGTSVTSGSASGAINLTVGDNTLTIIVTAQNGTTTETYTVTVNRAAPPATITLSPAGGALTAGQVGTAYSQTFTASGGTGPYSYALTSGALPGGLSLNTSTGEVTGTPTAAGTANFTITATDANTDTGSAVYSLQINAAPASISFSPAGGALPEAMAGEDYTTAITVSGGTSPYLFSVSAGALPPGMVLNVSTGVLSGPLDPDTEGSYSFTIQVSDANNATASAAYTLEVQTRAVTVTDKVVTVPAGETPGNVNLATGATGGPFIEANIVSVEPSNAGTARIVNSQFAQAGGGGSAGFYLKFTPDPAYSGQVTVRFSLTSSLGISNTGSVIYNLGYNPQKVAAEIDSLVRGFVRTRQGLIANAVKVPGLRDRRRMQTANEIVSMRFTPSERGMSLGFATSLEQMNAASNALTPGLKAEALAFNVWIQGSASAHTRKQNDGRWGNFAMLSAGADYLLADWALVGVSFHYDHMSDPTPGGARLSGNGWLAGPYASIEVYRNVFWDTRLFLGGSANDIDTQFWDGGFDTTRWMADTALSGEWQLDSATTLSPTLRAVYLSEKIKDYGVRNGAGDEILMDGFIEEQFRVSGALELARLFILDNGMLLTPALELTGGYAGLGGRGAFGAAEGSLTLTDGSRWRLNAGVKVNVEGDGSTSLTAKAGAGIRF